MQSFRYSLNKAGFTNGFTGILNGKETVANCQWAVCASYANRKAHLTFCLSVSYEMVRWTAVYRKPYLRLTLDIGMIT